MPLEANNFVGSIPSDVGLMLANLRSFILGGYQFSGGMPKSLGNCSHLSLLDFSDNLLTGPVPQELGMLTALKRLYLWGNSLSRGQCATMCILDVLSNCSIFEAGSNRFIYQTTISWNFVKGNRKPLSQAIKSCFDEQSYHWQYTRRDWQSYGVDHSLILL
ncbi:hypothetical protein SUGI_1046840 [Cryptomeria japonica]|nr:hypothetical protein SUGI_1046840 [Cryptomeria japonica]